MDGSTGNLANKKYTKFGIFWKQQEGMYKWDLFMTKKEKEEEEEEAKKEKEETPSKVVISK